MQDTRGQENPDVPDVLLKGQNRFVSGATDLGKAKKAKLAGFRAAKLEVMVNGPYAHHGLDESNEAIVDMVAACRSAMGKEFVIMVDVCYCWSSAKEALRVMRQLEPYDLYFMETPIRIDDLEGHRILSDHSPIPIAAGGQNRPGHDGNIYEKGDWLTDYRTTDAVSFQAIAEAWMLVADAAQDGVAGGVGGALTTRSSPSELGCQPVAAQGLLPGCTLMSPAFWSCEEKTHK